MGELNYKPSEITHTLENKLGVAFRDRRERVGWYILDGRKQVRFSVPRLHRSWGTGTIADIIRQSWLNKPEFRALVDCPMSGTDYEHILRERLTRT